MNKFQLIFTLLISAITILLATNTVSAKTFKLVTKATPYSWPCQYQDNGLTISTNSPCDARLVPGALCIRLDRTIPTNVTNHTNGQAWDLEYNHTSAAQTCDSLLASGVHMTYMTSPLNSSYKQYIGGFGGTNTSFFGVTKTGTPNTVVFEKNTSDLNGPFVSTNLIYACYNNGQIDANSIPCLPPQYNCTVRDGKTHCGAFSVNTSQTPTINYARKAVVKVTAVSRPAPKPTTVLYNKFLKLIDR